MTKNYDRVKHLSIPASTVKHEYRIAYSFSHYYAYELNKVIRSKVLQNKKERIG